MRKRFGQHFLADSWARKIVAALEPRPADIFLEIGPGKGALTRPLAESGCSILAIEIDRDLSAALAASAPANVTVITADVLTTDVTSYLTGLEGQHPFSRAGNGAPTRFRVVGNLPYYITSPILFRLIDLQRTSALFTDATVMVQREVADRLLAPAGTREYGVLTISVARDARVRRVLDLPPGAFTPPPKVRSAVVQLTFGGPTVQIGDRDLFDGVVRRIFGQRRKTLANALKSVEMRAGDLLAELGIDGRRRPETLTLQELAALADGIGRMRRTAVL